MIRLDAVSTSLNTIKDDIHKFDYIITINVCMTVNKAIRLGGAFE